MQREVNLIVASDENCPELAMLNKSLIDDGGSNNNMTIEELELRMHQFISNGYFAIFFDVENEHVGYALVDSRKSPIFIRQFYMSKSFRRKGYGKKAFNKLVDFFDADKVDLSVLFSNKVGYKFWKSCGLVPYEIIMQYREE